MPGTATPSLTPVAGHRSLKADIEAAERQHQSTETNLALADDRQVAARVLFADARKRAKAGGCFIAKGLSLTLLDEDFDDNGEFLQALHESVLRNRSDNHA